jgi:hypothetical protein
LVVQSPTGQLSSALQRIEQLYAWWFNRTRERDGHAFKGRFFSRMLEDEIDLACVVDYVDRNAVEAGMAESPASYPHGSARYYLGELGPRWLSRDVVESLACRIAGIARFEPNAYLRLWSVAQRSGAGELIQRASRSRGVAIAPLRVLVRSGPEYVQRWLLENLEREEGRSQPCLVVAGDELIRRVMLHEAAGGSAASGSALLTSTAGLLHAISGWTMNEIASRFQVSQPTVYRAVAAHRRRLRESDSYRTGVVRLITDVIASLYGPFVHSSRCA